MASAYYSIAQKLSHSNYCFFYIAMHNLNLILIDEDSGGMGTPTYTLTQNDGTTRRATAHSFPLPR